MMVCARTMQAKAYICGTLWGTGGQGSWWRVVITIIALFVVRLFVCCATVGAAACVRAFVRACLRTPARVECVLALHKRICMVYALYMYIYFIYGLNRIRARHPHPCMVQRAHVCGARCPSALRVIAAC